MGFYGRSSAQRRHIRYGGFGAFGDVVEAQEAVNIAQGKLNNLLTQEKAQQLLIDFTLRAQKNCNEDGGNIVGGIFTLGASVAICLAEQTTALGQRRGQMGQIKVQIVQAKGDLMNAQAAFTAAKAQAASAPPADMTGTSGSIDVGGGQVGSSSRAASSGGGSGRGGISSLLSNPLVLGGGALVFVGLGALLLRGKGP